MDFKERERKLKKIYLDALPGRLDELRLGVQEVYRSGEKQQALQALYRAVHNLAGSGATYGFEAIGDKAAEMEAWLEGFVENNTLPASDDEATFRLYLDQLQHISEQCQPTAAP